MIKKLALILTLCLCMTACGTSTDSAEVTDTAETTTAEAATVATEAETTAAAEKSETTTETAEETTEATTETTTEATTAEEPEKALLTDDEIIEIISEKHNGAVNLAENTFNVDVSSDPLYYFESGKAISNVYRVDTKNTSFILVNDTIYPGMMQQDYIYLYDISGNLLFEYEIGMAGLQENIISVYETEDTTYLIADFPVARHDGVIKIFETTDGKTTEVFNREYVSYVDQPEDPIEYKADINGEEVMIYRTTYSSDDSFYGWTSDFPERVCEIVNIYSTSVDIVVE